MTTFLIIATIIGGVIVLGAVIFKPKLFWPALIIISVGTAGLKAKGTYSLTDEYLLFWLILAVIIVALIEKVRFGRKPVQIQLTAETESGGSIQNFITENIGISKESFLERFHKWAFYLFILYMIVQSLRGFFIFQDLRIVRWIVLYSILGLFAFILSKKPFSFFEGRKTALFITITALIYFLSYQVHGLFGELVRGINRFNLQGVEWSGTSKAVFPLIVALPAAIFLIGDHKWILKLLGISFIILAIINGFYYDSRISLILVFIFLLFLPFVIKVPKEVIIGFLIFLVFLGSFIFYKIDAERQGDISRYVHFRAGFDTLGNNWETWLFGYGFYSHRFLLAPYLNKYYSHYDLGFVSGEIRTESFTALTIDTGLIGLILLAINFLLSAIKISVMNIGYRKIIFLMILIMAFGWLLITNINGMILLYLLIMPFGIIIQLSKYEKN
ncbi:MAG: hypothetical protein ABH956_02380 [Candidatus Nealsonbacteria bacterium]